MKIAVIGTGIAGLAAIHHLAPHHQAGTIELTVFEADGRVGGHANTVEVESERGVEQVDTGFIVFNRRNYPVFSSMLEELEVPSRPSNMSFSVNDGRGFEYSGRSPAGLFADRRNLVRPEFLRMLAEVPAFQRRLKRLAEMGEEITLDQFMRREGFSEALKDNVVNPLVASVWSADDEGKKDFPARFLARFLDNHGLLSLRDRPRWRTVEGGSRSYVERVIEPVGDRVHRNCRVASVRRAAGLVFVTPAHGEAQAFDQVILATHAPQSLRVLADGDREERRFLAAFPYRRNEAVLHSDRSVMPRRDAAWASWNYRIGARRDGLTALTYDMNRLQGLECEKRFFVSLNMDDQIDPGLVHHRVAYEHPVFTTEGILAQNEWQRVSGRGGVHFAGAWLRNGFHEDGAFTGRRAAMAALDPAFAEPVLEAAA